MNAVGHLGFRQGIDRTLFGHHTLYPREMDDIL